MIRIIAALLISGIWCAPLAQADTVKTSTYASFIEITSLSITPIRSGWPRPARSAMPDYAGAPMTSSCIWSRPISMCRTLIPAL